MNKGYSLEITNKVIVVTGGYGHLGTSIVTALGGYGAKVFVLGRHKNKFTEAFQEDSEKIRFIQGDVSSAISISEAFNKIVNDQGRIDVLVNNAYYSKGNSPEKMTDEEWAIGIDGTLSNVFRCIREVIPVMKGQKQGKIINVSSMYGMVAPDFSVYDVAPDSLNPPHYGAAKAGILQLTKYYASYLGSSGITVNCVTPGPFPSLEVQKNHKFIEKLSARTLLGRIGKPEDLAGAFVFLSSDAANFITGQNLVVDGG